MKKEMNKKPKVPYFVFLFFCNRKSKKINEGMPNLFKFLYLFLEDILDVRKDLR